MDVRAFAFVKGAVMRRLIFPMLLGVSGVAVLLTLGVWQVQRLDWKRDLLMEIDSRISAPAVELPADPQETRDEYLAVVTAGQLFGLELHVLTSGTAAGTGYRVISGFETSDGRRVLLDQGLLGLRDKDTTPEILIDTTTTLSGNLLWPDDKTSSTPEPDMGANIWFARDVAAMAQVLGTEPTMIVLRNASHLDPRLTPLPVSSSGIKNDHREYAITWFLLALVWAVMSGYLIQRTLRPTSRKDT